MFLAMLHVSFLLNIRLFKWLMFALLNIKKCFWYNQISGLDTGKLSGQLCFHTDQYGRTSCQQVLRGKGMLCWWKIAGWQPWRLKQHCSSSEKAQLHRQPSLSCLAELVKCPWLTSVLWLSLGKIGLASSATEHWKLDLETFTRTFYIPSPGTILKWEAADPTFCPLAL